MLAVETDTGTWIAAGISAVALLVPVLIYMLSELRLRSALEERRGRA
jgi:hypothetical protein